MKAIVQDVYGSADVLELRDVDPPVAAAGQVLVRIRAASVNPYDWHVMRGMPYIARVQGIGLRTPRNRVLGSDLAGQVEAVGDGVTRFRPGDEVYAHVGSGAFAEYASVPEEILAPKPANLTFEQAAAVPLAGLTALQGLRGVRPGQRVLIVGASGGVGTLAVQIAKMFGAHVTGVCSTPSAELVRSLGADSVIDYTREDFTRGGPYDLILQLAGTQSPRACRRALTRDGTLVLSSGDSDGRVIGPVDRILKAAVLSPFVSQTLGAIATRPSAEDLETLKELVEAGELAPVVDRVYPLAEVPDAVRHVETGHARGKAVIAV